MGGCFLLMGDIRRWVDIKEVDQGLFLWYLVINLNFSNCSSIVPRHTEWMNPEGQVLLWSIQSPHLALE